MLTAEEIKAAALDLPPDEFESLVDDLAVIRGGSTDADADWEDEWAAELQRRIAEIDSGDVTPIPIEEARAQWQALLHSPSEADEALADLEAIQAAPDARAFAMTELSPAGRLDMAARLIASLADDTPEALSPELRSMVERRVKEIEEGATTVPIEEVFAKMRAMRNAHPHAS